MSADSGLAASRHCPPPPDNGLLLSLKLMDERMERIEDYFAEKAEADGDENGFIPNEEMRRQTDASEVRRSLRIIMAHLERGER